MLAKLSILHLLKIKTFKKSYDIIIFVHDVTNKVSRDSNHTVNVVIWSRFGNSSISMREITKTSNICGFEQKSQISFIFVSREGCSWFKFNNDNRYSLEVLQHCCKRVKTKSQKVLRINSNVCRTYRGKTGRRENIFVVSSLIGLTLDSYSTK